MTKRCFVMMPFDKSFEGIWKNVIYPTLVASGDKCERADDVFKPGSIINDIIQSIQDADYLVLCNT